MSDQPSFSPRQCGGPATASDFYDALNAMGRDYSAMSWSGFNLFGDEKSVAELRRLEHEANAVVPALRKELIAALATPPAPAEPSEADVLAPGREIARVRDRRSQDVLAWALDIFGPVAGTQMERTARFVEEAVELAHAAGLGADVVARIVERVYSRPAGSIPKEVGQAGLTLEAFAANVGVSLEAETAREWDRIRTIPQAEWARRHSAKQALGIAG